MLVRNGSLLLTSAMAAFVRGDLMIFQYHFGVWIPPASSVIGICWPLTCGNVKMSCAPLKINTSSANRPDTVRAAFSTTSQLPPLVACHWGATLT
uniref:Putative secreted protein n=1 Tax=Anopheles darlingi TaxID=43151 RepID=A0A2M4DLK3_ANODA